jgi:hypothetical protein
VELGESGATEGRIKRVQLTDVSVLSFNGDCFIPMPNLSRSYDDRHIRLLDELIALRVCIPRANEAASLVGPPMRRYRRFLLVMCNFAQTYCTVLCNETRSGNLEATRSQCPHIAFSRSMPPAKF